MLQQTQVATVIGYYERFLSRFPDLATLAAASQEEVMPYWAGLGYYARARNLHRCAQTLFKHWGGAVSKTLPAIATLSRNCHQTPPSRAPYPYGPRCPPQY